MKGKEHQEREVSDQHGRHRPTKVSIVLQLFQFDRANPQTEKKKKEKMKIPLSSALRRSKHKCEIKDPAKEQGQKEALEKQDGDRIERQMTFMREMTWRS